MRVAVTGGSGFIGTNLVESLVSSGNDVLSLDIVPPRNSDHGKLWKRVDLLDSLQLSTTIRNFEPDTVFHLGARTDLKGTTADDYPANYEGVENLIDAVASAPGPTRTIYASSRLVFAIGHAPRHDFDYLPSTAYGESKIRGEEIVLRRASEAGDWCIVRPTSIWGPWFGTPYRDFFDQIDRRRYLRIPGRDPRKTFGYVGNAVHSLLRLALASSSETRGKVLWLADYEPLVLSEWSRMIALELGKPSPLAVPLPVLKMAAIGGDIAAKLGRDAPITTFRLNNMLTDMVYDTHTLQDIVGPLPFTTRQGVAETVKWMRRNDLGPRA